MSALLLLFRLKSIASFRNLWRDCKTPSGFFRALFSIGFLCAMSSPVLIYAVWGFDEEVPAEYYAKTRFFVDNVLPLLFGWFCFVAFASARKGRALDFSLAEVDFLFTAPFSRRQILIYKVLGIITSSFAICIPINMFVGVSYVFIEGNLVLRFVSGLLMIFFVLLLVRLLFAWGGLVRESVMLRLFSPARKIVAFLVGVAILIGMLKVRNQFDWSFLNDPEKMLPVALSFLETDAMQFVMAPFRVFTNLLLCESFGEFAFLCSVCIGLISIVIWLIMRTDENYMEKELQYSQLKLEVAKQTQDMETAFVGAGKSSTLPMLPFLNGVGPLVWRQLQTFYRTKKLLLVMNGFYFLFVLGLMLVDQGKADQAQSRFGLGMAMLCMTAFVVPIMIPMGFQTDLKRIDMFKALPLSSWEITAGQLIAPVLAIVAMQYATIVIFLFAAPGYYVYWLASAAYSPVLAMVILCTVNSVSLLYPRQPDDGVVREFENVGHILVFVFLLGVVAVTIGCVLGAAGYATYLLTQNVIAILVACWLVFAVASVFGVWITSRVYENFDVSRHQL